MTIAKKYADSNRASKFIPDLLKVDVPELFHRNQSICQNFCQELRRYIRNHSLRNSFLKNFIQYVVSHHNYSASSLNIPNCTFY